MLTSLEMTILSSLAGMGYLLAVFRTLLTFIAYLLILIRIGVADPMAKLL